MSLIGTELPISDVDVSVWIGGHSGHRGKTCSASFSISTPASNANSGLFKFCFVFGKIDGRDWADMTDANNKLAANVPELSRSG